MAGVRTETSTTGYWQRGGCVASAADPNFLKLDLSITHPHAALPVTDISELWSTLPVKKVAAVTQAVTGRISGKTRVQQTNMLIKPITTRIRR